MSALEKVQSDASGALACVSPELVLSSHVKVRQGDEKSSSVRSVPFIPNQNLIVEPSCLVCRTGVRKFCPVRSFFAQFTLLCVAANEFDEW